MTLDPPGAAIRLLRFALPPDEAASIAGDLTELFADRVDRGAKWNAIWFWSAALVIVLRLAIAGVGGAPRERGRRLMLDRLWTAYRQALRRLRYEWRYALGVIVVLAVGIGPAAAMLSIVEKIWLRPLGYADAERLGMVRVGLGQLSNHPGLALSEVLDLRRTNTVFDAVEAEARRFELSLGSGESMRPVSAVGVTPGLLPMLGVSPAIGRTFTDADAKAGDAAPVLIDYGLWQSSFGGAVDIAGRRVQLNGRATEIIGVLPRGFTLITGRSVPEPIDVYTPLAIREHRNFWGFPTIVRLKPNVSYEAANAALANLSNELSRQYPVAYGTTGVRMSVRPLKDDLIRDTRPALRAALAAVLLLLLVAVADAAALIIARLTVRERELAVRSAIGAGRSALALDVLVESVLLSVSAAILGSALAAACVAGARALVPHTVPRWSDITLGWELVAYSTAFSLAGLFASGLIPLWKVSRASSSWQTLRGATPQGGGATGATSRLVLAGAQIALTVVLGFGAMQLVRSAEHLRRVNLGFDPNVLTFRTPIDPATFNTPVKGARLYEQARDRLKNLSGVTAAGAISHLPLTGSFLTDSYSTDLSKVPAWDQPTANYYAITPGYFAAMRIPLLAGRDVTDADDQSGRHLIVVDESLARSTFGSVPRAIGRTLKLGWGIPDSQVVGVVGQVRGIDVTRDVRPQIYVPFGVFPFTPMHMIVRAAGDPARVADAARAAVAQLGTGRAMSAFVVLTDHVAAATSTLRSVTDLVAALAISAGLLSAGGLYTVIAYLVYQRRRSTAIRSALGASPAQLLWLHLRVSNRVLAVALPISLLLAAAAAPLFSALLYGVAERDVASLALAAGIATAVSLVSTLLPVRRAVRVDPVSVLRAD